VLQAGYRAVLIVPLLRPDQVLGALVVRRREPGEFEEATKKLLTTFAEQSVLAIQNARLFHLDSAFASMGGDGIKDRL
jgi:GAF domain-containing protein